MLQKALNSPPFLSLVLFVIGTAIFFPRPDSEFLNWDDDRFVVNNPHVASLDIDNVSYAFSDIRFELYQPLFLVSFMVDSALWPSQPQFYKWHNLALFLLSACGLFCLLMRLNIPPLAAFVGTLFFVVAPYRAESVAWISSRKDVLALFFAMASWHLHLSAQAGAQRRSRAIFVFLAVLSFSLAVLAKFSAIVLPLMMFTVDYLIKRTTSKKSAFYAPWYLIPLSVFISIETTQIRAHPELAGSPALAGALGRLSLVGWTAVHYVKTAFFPVSLAPLYPEPSQAQLTQGLLSAIFLGTFVSTTYFFFWKKWRHAKVFLAAVLLFCIGLLPYANFVPVYYLVADRYLLFPSLGIALLGASAFQTTLEKRKKLLSVAASVLVGLVLLTWGLATADHCRHFANSTGLWAHAVTSQPEAFFARIKYGHTLLEQSRPQEAIVQFEQARKLKPLSPSAWHGLIKSSLTKDAEKGVLNSSQVESLALNFIKYANQMNQLISLQNYLKQKGLHRAAQVVTERLNDGRSIDR